LSVCEFDVARGGIVRVKPNIFLDYFLDRVRAVRGKDKIGGHFFAVTDPGSPLESRAKKLSFAWIFYGIPPIGGRSAEDCSKRLRMKGQNRPFP
jgi:hypothetical protein